MAYAVDLQGFERFVMLVGWVQVYFALLLNTERHGWCHQSASMRCLLEQPDLQGRRYDHCSERETLLMKRT